MISVYIPLYNSAKWCEELQPIEGFRYIASDNMSEDGSGEILRRKGVEVITQPKNLASGSPLRKEYFQVGLCCKDYF